jgi:outer membrane protein TolC
VSLDYFLSRDSLPTDRDWNGILSLQMPLFAAGRIDAEVREAWSQFRQEVLRYSLLRRTIQRDLATAIDDLATLEARLVELRVQTAANAAALRQAEAGTRIGLATNLDLLTAQDQLQRSEIDVVEGELQRKEGWLQTLRVTGALTEGTVDVPVPPPPPPRAVPESPFVRLPQVAARGD